MRNPLDQFADRIVRNGEIEEFITGLIREKHVSPEKITKAVENAQGPPQRSPARRREIVGSSEF